MTLSRRAFLNRAGMAAASLWLGQAGQRRFASASSSSPGCALLDLGTACSLQESFRGYQAALEETPIEWVCGWPGSFGFAPRVIVPAAAGLDRALADQLEEWLERGTWLLLECGAAYVDDRRFLTLRASLESRFGFSVAPAVDLWAESRNRVPYIEYRWPHSSKVRDFSRVSPVLAPVGEVIGWADSVPVAMMRRAGRGRLIFLGSLLGPVLLAGDREAHQWLGEALDLGRGAFSPCGLVPASW